MFVRCSLDIIRGLNTGLINSFKLYFGVREIILINIIIKIVFTATGRRFVINRLNTIVLRNYMINISAKHIPNL